MPGRVAAAPPIDSSPIPRVRRSTTLSSRSDLFRQALSERVLVADGAMGTMLQAADPSLDDFEGHEGCNEVLNVTRPDIVRSVHDAYLEVGVDAVETNTFGANLGNLGEYDIQDRIYELAEAGARIAAEAVAAWSTPEHPRFAIGSVGPGTKLPSLGHVPFATLRDAYAEQARGLVDGGVDLILIETSQDLLQAKAAVIGATRALKAAGDDRHHAQGIRDRRRAHGPRAVGHRRDRPQLCHRTHGDERAPAAPVAARPDPRHLHAQRRAADADQGGRGIPADAAGAGAGARAVRP